MADAIGGYGGAARAATALTLPFVALAGPAEADHDRGQGARLVRPTGALRVAFREGGSQVVELAAAQAVRLVVLHDQQVDAGGGATGARPLVQRIDDDQVGRLVHRSAQPLGLAVREVGGDPVRAVGPFDVRVAADAELQRAPIAGAGRVGGLAGRQPTFGDPGPKRPHRARLLGGAGLDQLFEAADPTLAPQVDVRRGEPAEAQEHIDGADVGLRGQCLLGGADDAFFQTRVRHTQRPSAATVRTIADAARRGRLLPRRAPSPPSRGRCCCRPARSRGWRDPGSH